MDLSLSNERWLKRASGAALKCDRSKRIAFFGGPEQNPANLDRQRGFVEELRALGHNVDVHHSDFTYNGGAALAQAAFSKETVPDSVFCANDLIAIGLLDTLTQDKSLVAPERLRVVGFDGLCQIRLF